jgi:hypothetical protein
LGPVAEQLSDFIKIKLPDTLFALVESLKEFVAKDHLIEVAGNCKLADIEKGKPWPDDLIHIEFETVPHQTRYLLSVETYHGSGGQFKKMEN